MLKNISKLTLLGIIAAIMVGCSGAGDAIDEKAVQSQADKEKKINEAAAANLPPGDGPAG